MDKYHSRVQICQIWKKYAKNSNWGKYFFLVLKYHKKIVKRHNVLEVKVTLNLSLSDALMFFHHCSRDYQQIIMKFDKH